MSFAVSEHPATSPILQTALKATLPYSIGLVYRTQHTNRTQDAHIITTFAPSDPSAPKCWAAAYLDRSMRPETELWMFAAGEVPGHSPSDLEFCPTCKKAVRVMLDYMSRLPVPKLHPEKQQLLEAAKLHEKLHPQTGPEARYPPSRGVYLRHLLMPSVVTLGACHHELVQICSEAGLVCPEFPGRESKLNKFVFKVSNLPQLRPLPHGLRWGEMRGKDIPIVQLRTEIPRGVKTLLSMKSVGVFDQSDTPVSWAFLGLDGSLTTLHTEPEYRGKGIAKAVSARIFREYAPALAVDNQDNAWAHADVYQGNTQSEAVCRSLGGTAMWNIFWVRIDLGKAGHLADR